MNSVNLIGYLVRHPDTRATGDTTVTKIRVAVDRGVREGADYIDVTAFGCLAGVSADYLARGARVGVSGRLAHRE